MALVNSRAPRLIQFRYTVEPRHNNPRYNDIPRITVDIAMIDITISSRPNVFLSQYSDVISTQSQFKQNTEFNTITLQ